MAENLSQWECTINSISISSYVTIQIRKYIQLCSLIVHFYREAISPTRSEKREKVKVESSNHSETMLNAKHIFVIVMALLVAVNGKKIADCGRCPANDDDYCKGNGKGGPNTCEPVIELGPDLCVPGEFNDLSTDHLKEFVEKSGSCGMKPTLMMALFMYVLD